MVGRRSGTLAPTRGPSRALEIGPQAAAEARHRQTPTCIHARPIQTAAKIASPRYHFRRYRNRFSCWRDVPSAVAPLLACRAATDVNCACVPADRQVPARFGEAAAEILVLVEEREALVPAANRERSGTANHSAAQRQPSDPLNAMDRRLRGRWAETCGLPEAR